MPPNVAQTRHAYCEAHVKRYKRDLLVANELGNDVEIRKARFCLELWERALEHNLEVNPNVDFSQSRHCEDCNTLIEGCLLCPTCGKVTT